MNKSVEELLTLMQYQISVMQSGEQELGYELVMAALRVAQSDLGRTNFMAPEWIDDALGHSEHGEALTAWIAWRAINDLHDLCYHVIDCNATGRARD